MSLLQLAGFSKGKIELAGEVELSLHTYLKKSQDKFLGFLILRINLLLIEESIFC